MPYSDDAKDLMLDALGAVALFTSAHTAYSSAGGNEVAGGTPAYARKGITWNAAAAGAMTAASAPVLDIPPTTTVRYIGFWDSLVAGVFYGMFPNGGTTPVPFEADDGTDTLTADQHGFVDDDTVTVWDTEGAVIPAGLTAGNVYFVINATTDALQLSLTQGGSAINLTVDGAGFLQKIVEETFAAQGTLTISAASLDLNL